MFPRPGELIEVAPGRWRDPALCSQQDLEAAQALAVEAARLGEDIAAMLAVAAHRGLAVPDELRERLSLGARGLPGDPDAARGAGGDRPAGGMMPSLAAYVRHARVHDQGEEER